jgi:uncharacterized protein
MKLLVDSSALAKRYIFENGSRKINSTLKDASELALCIILIPEIISALNRRVRENFLTMELYRDVKHQFMNDINDAIVLQLNPDVTARSVKLLEKYVLRSMDALHIACALEWEADLFVTADKRQLTAAKKEGLKTEYIK